MDTTFKRGKHLYKRGWLGLIPLVGGLAGLVLMLLGIFKYKDKKLILIGSAGLLFTVSIYSSMIYYFRYSTSFRKDFSVFCQSNLNDLIKSIEYYKVDNGNYPDSLDQLTKDGGLVIIYDPISQDDKDNNRQFYYTKLGDKYALFSSGVDRIPYNLDDIFPSQNFFDSTKTGLIKPNN